MFGVLVALLIILLVILVKRRLDYFSSRGIPYVKPTWKSVLKSFLPSTVTTYPTEIYRKERNSDNAIIGYFGAFLKPALLVLEPSMVQNVYIKDFSHFQDHGLELDNPHDPLACNLFNMNGSKWRAMRNKLLPAFTSGKLKGMIPTIENCAQSLIQDMKQDSKLRDDANVKNLFKRFTHSVIASCAFGIEPDSIKDPECEYHRILRKALKPSVSRQIRFLFLFSLPQVFKHFKIKIFPQDVEDFYMKLTRDAMEMRKKSGVKRNDFIQLLMELKEKGSVQVDHRDLEEDEKESMKRQQQLVESESTNNLEITHELLAAQSFLFIAAGYDNTAYLVAVSTYVLSKHKDIQQRVREEVRAAKSKHGGINYESLKDMKLLGACIDEALRIYSAQFIAFRTCTKTCTMSNGLTIEKGMQVYIPAYSIQQDSKYWRNPEEFIPERFLTDDVTPGTYMPFGDGPRICIAQRLALLMGKIMLAELLDNFELLSSKKTKEPIKIKLTLDSEIEGGLWGCFRPLSQ